MARRSNVVTLNRADARRGVDIGSRKLYLRSMETLPIKSERLAELEEFARRRGKSPAEALDEALAEYLEWERQDYQETVQAVRQGVEDVLKGSGVRQTQHIAQLSRGEMAELIFIHRERLKRAS